MGYKLIGLFLCFVATLEVRASDDENEIGPVVSTHQSPCIKFDFSKTLDPKDKKSLFEILDKSLFEVLGHNLLLNQVLPYLDLRTLSAVSCTCKEGQALVKRLKEILIKKVGHGFVNCSCNHLTALQYRVANTLHMAVYLWTFIGERQGTVWDGTGPVEELSAPLHNIIGQIGGERLSMAELPNPRLLEERGRYPHIYRLLGSLQSQAATMEEFRFQAIKEPPILFECPAMIGQLTGLTFMTISDCAVLTLPFEFSALTNLKSLYLANNNLRELPEAVLNLRNLRILSLSKNKLETLPKDMRVLAKLEDLNLDENPMVELPQGILTLHSLEFLHIGQTMITYLPLALCQMPKLRTIFIQESNNLLARPTPTFWQNTRRVYSDIFRPFVVIPEAWDMKKVSVMVGGEFVIVRNTVQEMTQGLMFRSLLFALVPIALPIGWFFFKPRDN